jgi:D-arabinose 1-dehydrogenase-like Zn-dependent alcohol dehydrogenase
LNLPDTGRVAVFDRPNGPFRVATYRLRPPAAGEVLVRVRMSTICRSDVHSWQGHRPSPCPGLLGHEIIGHIEALGGGIERDMRGHPLACGDRVTWSEYFVPGPHCLGVALDLPQKTPGFEKYGHMSAEAEPHHHGGFGEFCYVLPKSWILRLPDELSNEEATPINCGVATMIAATEAAGLRIGDTVVVQGLGLLGLYGAAIARARGAGRVVGLDTDASRRERAAAFGGRRPGRHDEERNDESREEGRSGRTSHGLSHGGLLPGPPFGPWGSSSASAGLGKKVSACA